jgi:putative flippase GtrA
MNIKMLFDKVFLKFLLVGVVNTIVGYTIMFVMHNAVHMSYWFSSGCGYYLSSILSFFLNRHFTFTVNRWSAFMVISFIVTIVVSYYLPYLIAEQAVKIIFQDKTEIFRGNIALIVGTCMASTVSYLGQRFVVFRKKEEKEEEFTTNHTHLTILRGQAGQHEKKF